MCGSSVTVEVRTPVLPPFVAEEGLRTVRLIVHKRRTLERYQLFVSYSQPCPPRAAHLTGPGQGVVVQVERQRSQADHPRSIWLECKTASETVILLRREKTVVKTEDHVLLDSVNMTTTVLQMLR